MNCKISLFSFFSIFLFSLGIAHSQNPNPLLAEDMELQQKWVDSIYDQLSIEEKIGQLFMISVSSNQSEAENEEIKKIISEYHIGGIIFSTGTPYRQVTLTNEYQELSQTPLLIGMDAEWGLAMRLDSVSAFPWNMALGAIQDPSLIEETGAAIGKNLKRMGVQLNFAPVVDINTNPNNPIIGNRSFGKNRDNVTEMALAFIKGMQSENVLSCAKHFPGHGDTSVDSHKSLPSIYASRQRLDSVELYPYPQLIAAGIPGIMIGHLNVPALEKQQNVPASLSQTIVSGLLKEQMRFQGLIFTDGLGMKGVSANTKPGEVSLKAFLAGNDVLLMPLDVKKASQTLVDAYQSGVFDETRLKQSVKKILMSKYKAGLNDFQDISDSYLMEDLNSIHHRVLNEKLMENALTVLKNDTGILPIRDLEIKKIAYVHFGDSPGDAFYDQLSKYAKVDKVKADHLDAMLTKLRNYNLVIIGYHKSDSSPYADYKFTDKELVWLYEISRKNQVILNVFTKPYALQDLNSSTNFDGILLGYQNSKIAQEKAAQLLFGAIEAKGALPVALGPDFPVGTGFKTANLQRLAYGLPESVGVNSYKLKKVDSIIHLAISKKMTPGVQVLVARHGKVIYDNNAGYHTYSKKIPVSGNDVYDLASLTKILGTLPLVMELVDKGELDLDTKISELLPGFRNSNKANITLKQVLSHYGRFKPWIPFYLYTLDPVTKKPSKKYYRNQPSRLYNTQVAEDLFIRNDIRDSVTNRIKESVLLPKLEYRYSDLPYYLLKVYLENSYGTSLDYLTQNHFYKSIGANYTTYMPLNHFPKNQIVPTAMDRTWRNQLLQGFVHDEGAAILGGIGGQAGIFSNANGVAKIMQMYLNGGFYGGKQFFSKETFQKFNTQYFAKQHVRRAVCFDKPQLDGKGNWPTFGKISSSSFGHSGFTGTYTWADPEEDLIYVFLSNKIHPNVGNKALNKAHIRTEIQKAIYEAIDYKK